MKQRNNSPVINGGKLQICMVVFISDPISLTLWGTSPLMIYQGDLTHTQHDRYEGTATAWHTNTWCEHGWLNRYLFYGDPKSPKIRVTVQPFHTAPAPILLSPVWLHSFLKLLLQWSRTPPSKGRDDEFMPNFFFWFLLIGSSSKTSKRSSHSRQS